MHKALRRMKLSGTLGAARRLVEVGQELVAFRSFDARTVRAFADTIGDFNPIHLDADYVSKRTNYPRPLVHGMLCASMFSAMFAQRLPGSIYREQSLLFHNPVCIDQQVCARIEVINVKHTSKLTIVSCDTSIRLVEQEDLAVTGKAKVVVLEETGSEDHVV